MTNRRYLGLLLGAAALCLLPAAAQANDCDTFYTDCAPTCAQGDEACFQNCFDALSAEGQQALQGLIACIQTSGCDDDDCIIQACNYQYAVCFNPPCPPGLDDVGQCDGNNAEWCDLGAYISIDCGMLDGECGFDETNGWYTCLNGGGSTPPVCGPGAGSCAAENGTPGCDNSACCQQICAADPFCCDTQWDDLCVSAAQANCASTTPDPADVCGDGVCGPTETAQSCPQDCAPTPTDVCGDGVCGPTESPQSCPADCPTEPTDVCGDGVCGPTETPQSCPEDCDEEPEPEDVCGDGVCGPTETIGNCPEDCTVEPPRDVCGDDICGPTEDFESCPEDCDPLPVEGGGVICELPEEGFCEDDILYFCDEFEMTVQIDCAFFGESCLFDEDEGIYDCFSTEEEGGPGEEEGEPGEGEGEPGEEEGGPGEGGPGEGGPGEGGPGEGGPGEGVPGEGVPGEGDPSEGDPSEGDPSEGDPGGGVPGEADNGAPGGGNEAGGAPVDGGSGGGGCSAGGTNGAAPVAGFAWLTVALLAAARRRRA